MILNTSIWPAEGWSPVDGLYRPPQKWHIHSVPAPGWQRVNKVCVLMVCSGAPHQLKSDLFSSCIQAKTSSNICNNKLCFTSTVLSRFMLDIFSVPMSLYSPNKPCLVNFITDFPHVMFLPVTYLSLCSWWFSPLSMWHWRGPFIKTHVM